MDVRRIALIGLLVLLAGFIFFTLTRGGDTPAPTPTETVRTVVKEVDYTSILTVATPLSRGSVVREDDLAWMDWPTDALTPALITETSTDTEGAEQTIADSLRGAIVKDQINPGEPAVLSKFIRAGDAGVMSALLKPGMRAVTVRISVDTASGGFIQPGDKVDVILRERVSAPGGGETNVVASTIFSDVTVLAIDQVFSNNPEGGVAIPGSTATLELSPRDSEDLIASQADGDLTLVLRGFTSAAAYAPSRAVRERRGVSEQPPIAVYRSGQVESILVQER